MSFPAALPRPAPAPVSGPQVFTSENGDAVFRGRALPAAMTQVFRGSRSQREPQFPRLRNRPGATGGDPDPAVHTVGTRVGGGGGKGGE